MRLKDSEIELVSRYVLENIVREECLELKADETLLLEMIRKAITDDLMIEDNLNREVEDIMKSHMDEIQEGSVDYRRLFAMIKNKLAKERNLILS